MNNTDLTPFAQFSFRIIESFFDHYCGGDIGGDDIQDWGEKYGLFTQVPYDPAVHGEDVEAGVGDSIYVLSDFAKEVKGLMGEKE